MEKALKSLSIKKEKETLILLCRGDFLFPPCDLYKFFIMTLSYYQNALQFLQLNQAYFFSLEIKNQFLIKEHIFTFIVC